MWHQLLPLLGRTKVRKVVSPVGQSLQDRGHQHPGDGLVEDGVTHSHDVHHRWGAQHRQHVGGHALPEVQQEALHLKEPTTSTRVSARDGKIPLKERLERSARLVKVGPDDGVQDPLTVGPVHHDEGGNLWAQTSQPYHNRCSFGSQQR